MSNLNYIFANAEIKDDAVIKLMDGKLNIYRRHQHLSQLSPMAFEQRQIAL